MTWWTVGFACVATTPAWASLRHSERDPLCVQPRGAQVGTALLVEYYEALPERREGMDSEIWAARIQAGLGKFKKRVEARYSEGTLQRLLDNPHTRTRRAAVLALGMIGS